METLNMRLIVWLKGARGVACLEALVASGAKIVALCVQPGPGTSWNTRARNEASRAGIPVISAPDPNDPALIERLRQLEPEVFILAGYGPILRAETIAQPSRACINLHGGMLPQYRGSSPLNWALINGEKEFGLSVIRVAPGVDAGDVLLERRFPIGPDDTILDLHKTANAAFPEMLLETLEQLRAGTLRPRIQNESEARYYPLRFPEDGLILFDMLSAQAVHNRIRALTEPYPCAYTYYAGQHVRLHASQLAEGFWGGEPGRIYRKKAGSLLVCAKDTALWIRDARMEDGTQLYDVVLRYERLATVAAAAESLLSGRRAQE